MFADHHGHILSVGSSLISHQEYVNIGIFVLYCQFVFLSSQGSISASWRTTGNPDGIQRGVRVHQSWYGGGCRSEMPQSKCAAAASAMEAEEHLVPLCPDLLGWVIFIQVLVF